jgi:hypothetical protein
LKRHGLMAVFSLFIIGAILIGSAMAEDKKMTEQEMMAAYAKYMNPGPQHKLLEPLIGSWDCVSRMWMDPGAPPTESKATAEKKWILGGRFIQEDASGIMGGMPFQGMGITGYDLIEQKYNNVWLDVMATSMMITSGQMDATGKVLTMTGSYKDPMADMQEKKLKTILRIVSNDQHIYEMYDIQPNGKEVKIFDLTYTRKK